MRRPPSPRSAAAVLVAAALAALLGPGAAAQSSARRHGGAVAAGSPAAAPAPAVVRLSADRFGTPADAETKHPSLSPDGRWVAFESDATNLGPPDPNPLRDVWVRDRDAAGNGLLDEPGGAALALVSLATDGTPADGPSFDPSVSSGGRHVAFATLASNLVPGDANGELDVVVRDRDTDGDGVYDEPGAVATVALSGGAAGASGLPEISADGRHVAFESDAPLGTALDGNGELDAYVVDRDPDGNGVLDEAPHVPRLLSVNLLGKAGNGPSSSVSISGDGRYVVFESAASDLVPGDGNGLIDVFLVDRDPGGDGVLDEGDAVLRRVSTDAAGQDANGASRRPHVSLDGRFVVFETDATDLGPFDPNGVRDVVVVDRDPDGDGTFDQGNATVALVSLPLLGLSNGNSIHGRVSADGRIVAFVSLASNLVVGDDNDAFDVFARDRDPDGNGVLDEGNGVTLVLSASEGGRIGNRLSGNGELSADGRYKVFVSDATNLVPGSEPPDLRDVFVRRVY